MRARSVKPGARRESLQLRCWRCSAIDVVVEMNRVDSNSIPGLEQRAGQGWQEAIRARNTRRDSKAADMGDALEIEAVPWKISCFVDSARSLRHSAFGSIRSSYLIFRRKKKLRSCYHSGEATATSTCYY
jgi:hypothetical protein